MTELKVLHVTFDGVKQETKRERFFAKTLVLVHKKGFKATTMRDIAQNLNFEVANVYNYIDSKQSFLENTLFGIQKEFLSSMDTAFVLEGTPKIKLEHIVTSYIKITAKRPYEQALLVNEWRNLLEPQLQEFIKRREDYEKKMEMILLKGVASGEFKEMDCRLGTQIILATLRWSYKQFLNQNKTKNYLVLQKQLMDFILYGIGLQ